MISINSNIASVNAQHNLNKVNKQMEAAMEQLSSGKRINSASDDAAGMAIASRMTSEVKGIDMAIRNASDGQALIDTAEGTMIEVVNMLQRARELAVQASNDTNSESDRASLQLEVNSLLTEIDRVSANTNWAGQALLGGASAGSKDFTFQIGTGSQASDSVKVSVDEMSTKTLGLGATGEAAGGRTTGHAGITYSDGKLSILGKPEHGDTFRYGLVEITYSTGDQFTDNVAGVASEIKAGIDTLIAALPLGTGGIFVIDNGDGSLSISQPSEVSLDSFNSLVGTAVGTFDEENCTLTISGNISNTDTMVFNINGLPVQVTRHAADGYGITAAGSAAALAAEIKQTAFLESVLVTDHGDGSLTIKQTNAPIGAGVEMVSNTLPTLSINYDNGGIISVAGAFVAAQTISFDLMGKEVSFETSSTDGFGDTLAGVASQMAAAINNAGISGISAAKTPSANTVTLTADVESKNAVVNNGNNFIATTLGEAATSVISISGTDTFVGAPTAATYANGDAYTFEVAGQEVRLVIDTADCYLDTKEGVSRQMKDLVDDLNIEGLVVAVDDGTSAGLSITRVMTGVVAGGTGSTFLTNISSLAADEVGAAKHSGSIDVSTSAGAADALDRIDAALLTINTQRAELGAVSNRMDHTINNLSNVSSNLQSGLSRIQDADFAKVTGDLTKSQIMSQAATAMLAQANASKQGVLSLLQG